ncbi:MAG TPA: glycosyltransferase family 4 protein [Solirubrobacteraceae bacterium]
MPDAARRADRSRGRMPRLLILTPDFPPARGGIQVVAHRLAAGLGGFEVRVVTLADRGADGFDRSAGLAIRRVRAPRRPGAARNLVLNAIALIDGVRFRPQLILSAHIVTSPAAAILRGLLGGRTVQYFYAKEIADKPRLARFAARRADAVIAISSYTSGLLAAAGGIAGESLRLIPPGVDPPTDPRPQPAGRPTFVTIARLVDRYKGHDVLVRALPSIRAQVPNVEWVVIGDGPLRPELEALAREQGVAECIRFVGSVSDEERDGWLRRADLLAMPSRLPGEGRAGEGFGIVYLEAATYGKPVVAGDVGGALDAVIDGETGLLVDPADPEAVAAAITRLLIDRELAVRLGAAGARRARRYYWAAIVEQVRAVLLEQLGSAAGQSLSAPAESENAGTPA